MFFSVAVTLALRADCTPPVRSAMLLDARLPPRSICCWFSYLCCLCCRPVEENTHQYEGMAMARFSTSLAGKNSSHLLSWAVCLAWIFLCTYAFLECAGSSTAEGSRVMGTALILEEFSVMGTALML